MSPNISASSKIAQSPKKKILVERNDPVRTSITLSDEVPSNYNNDPESLFDTVTMDSDLCNDVIAPLDADPSLPPYDPRTNYLSPGPQFLLPPYDPRTNYLFPRPQFLHYKPNPRIEVLLNKEKRLDVKKLDDIFLSELLSDNFSDIDGSESSLTEDSPKESNGSSSEEAIVDQEEGEEPKILEPEIHVAEEIFEQKMRTKPRSSTISKFFSLLLVLVIGLVSISVPDSPILATTPGSIDLRFSNLNNSSDIPVLAKANSHFKQFSGEAISYFSELIYEVGRIDYAQPLKFVNLTDLEESSSIYHGYLKGSICWGELDKELEPIELEEDEESETEPDEKEFQMEADLDDSDEMEIEGAHEFEIEEVSAIQLAEVVNEADSLEKDLEQGQHDLEIEEAFAIQLAEVNEADSLEKDLDQGQHDLVETEEVSVVLAEGNESDSSERDLDEGLATSNIQLELAESKSSIADTAISSDASPESVKDNPESLVKDDSAVEEDQPLEMLKGRCCGREDPSEMSSFQISSSYSKKYPKSENDESLATSEFSMGSPSYGSFTTYERIPIKHASGGGEEVITPENYSFASQQISLR
ncbi:hypothetical protein K7X08_008952 [Anisodus acutangulus]|uniref:Uncharacterized protein n=1 Tax=Anisodus acutangulus TaxID=402998 RepID=A0A9Q1MZU3_9SOLA|nr:hypothetical protein K7X08_008952 [Anisodus acutangulus]